PLCVLCVLCGIPPVFVRNPLVANSVSPLPLVLLCLKMPATRANLLSHGQAGTNGKIADRKMTKKLLEPSVSFLRRNRKDILLSMIFLSLFCLFCLFLLRALRGSAVRVFARS